MNAREHSAGPIGERLAEGRERVRKQARPGGARGLFALQRAAGNSAVSALLAGKLKSSGDSVADIDRALSEVRGCTERLQHELGDVPRYFSYPYGRPRQITEANRELVRAAGYTCCLSAFGGGVRPGDDAFRLRRTPVSPWFTSPAQFGFEVAFDRE